MLERKVKEGYTVFLVDHHKTALGLNIYPWARVALDISGLKTSATSYLLHLYTVSLLDFHPNPLLSQYAELVRLYDTWEWSEKPSASSSLAKDLNDLLYLVDLKTYADMLLEHMNGASYGVDFYLPRRAELVLEPERARISAYLKKKVKQVTKGNVTIAGKTYYVGVVSAESYISELGNDLCKKNEDLDFIAIVNFDRSRISLRTIRDIDMSFIAQCFAGGGHEKAAGFSLKGNYDTSVFINLFLSGIFM
ncbi:Oligoribonuclease NrnB [compost metagenome]